jgi:hypothetical protein
LAAARPPPRGEGADFPVLHPPRVGQSPGGSLARPSRPHLRPGPGEPVRWARPPCGGAPPLGPFRHRLHRPRWGVSLRFTRQAWPQPPGWNHHPKPPAPTGQAYWDGEPTWPGTAVAVALWWPPHSLFVPCLSQDPLEARKNDDEFLHQVRLPLLFRASDRRNLRAPSSPSALNSRPKRKSARARGRAQKRRWRIQAG